MIGNDLVTIFGKDRRFIQVTKLIWIDNNVGRPR